MCPGFQSITHIISIKYVYTQQAAVMPGMKKRFRRLAKIDSGKSTQMLDYNVPGGKLNRGLAVADVLHAIKEGQVGSLCYIFCHIYSVSLEQGLLGMRKGFASEQAFPTPAFKR